MNYRSAKSFLVMLMGIFLISSGYAQDSKITTGVVAFQQQDFDKAVEALDVGLSNPGDLKEKNVPKGYYYRGKARLMQMRMAAQTGDTAKLKTLENALFDAYDDFKKAKETDDGKWGDKVDAELNMLKTMMLQGGLAALNMIYQEKSLTDDQKKEAYKEVMKYCNVVIEMDPTDYVAYDLRAQSKLNTGDSTAALKDFNLAIETYTKNLPAQPDMLVGYAFYRASLVYRYQKNDLENAYNTVKAGQELLDSEIERLKGMDNLNEDFKAKKAEQYSAVKEDLRRLEMDILLNYPEKREEALAEFERATKENPKDYIVHVAYANMLEIVDRQKAIETYKKAIAIKPDDEIAYFNLGALYNNMGKDLYDQANESDDYEKADELKNQGNEQLKKALDMFEKAVEVNPNSTAAIRAAKQIAITIGDMEKYNKFKEMEAGN